MRKRWRETPRLPIASPGWNSWLPALHEAARVAAPLALGFAAGFGAAVLALRRWLAASATPAGRDILAGLRRHGWQHLALAVAIAALGSWWLAARFHEEPWSGTMQRSLWGILPGMLAGVRWVYRRGLN